MIALYSSKWHGFDNQSIKPEDWENTLKYNPRFGQLIAFEYLALPFKQMSLFEYERRIKRLAYVDSNDKEVVSLRQLKASFEDEPIIGK